MKFDELYESIMNESIPDTSIGGMGGPGSSAGKKLAFDPETVLKGLSPDARNDLAHVFALIKHQKAGGRLYSNEELKRKEVEYSKQYNLRATAEEKKWQQWQKDKIPVKEIFDDNTFEKKIKIKSDGTWFVKRDQTLPNVQFFPDTANVNQGAIIV